MERKLIIKTFKKLNSKKIDYIVLRKQEQIQKVSLTSDLDLIAKWEQREKIKELFTNLGYSFYDDQKNNTYLYGSKPHWHFLNKKEDVHIDIVFGLFYKSTSQGEWIPVHKLLQESIWNNKKIVSSFWKYKPSNIDLLIHLICHCIFDKRKIDDYYSGQILKLFKLVNKKELTKKLEVIFFKFTPVLVKKISKEDFDNLFGDYISFGGY